MANSRGDHGFAPATFLEPIDAGHRIEEEEWRDVEDDDRKLHVFMLRWVKETTDFKVATGEATIIVDLQMLFGSSNITLT